MWDWVGRISELAAVGLPPAALQGIDIDRMLFCRHGYRHPLQKTAKNPAALLALMWYHATDGKGNKDMVVLPYKDRLMLFSKYLQQLVMESWQGTRSRRQDRPSRHRRIWQQRFYRPARLHTTAT